MIHIAGLSPKPAKNQLGDKLCNWVPPNNWN